MIRKKLVSTGRQFQDVGLAEIDTGDVDKARNIAAEIEQG